VSDGEISRRLALAGQGVARLSLVHIRPDIDAGRLVPVLEAYNPGDVEEVNVVYVGHGGRLPARVRALIDFLVDEVDLDAALERFD
jgi:DNA-binding transcriptional LysR family regulator